MCLAKGYDRRVPEDHDRASGSLAAGSGGREEPPPRGWISADPLSDVLSTVRLTGASFFQIDASAPWVAEAPEAGAFASILLPGDQQIISYHVVTRGPIWGGLVGEPSVRLEAGDLLLVPHGDPYVLSSEPGMRSADPVGEIRGFFREMVAGRLPPVVRSDGGGAERLGVVCGFLGCDVRPFNPALATLPRAVHLRRPPEPASDRLDYLVELVLSESAARSSGGQCVLLRLGELLFVEVVRRYLCALSEEETGWLAALRDPAIGHALTLLHQRPAESWTVESLGREVGLSRSALAARFAQLVGQPPMQYLARWRMQLAANLLLDGTSKVYAVASAVGYESEAAFSRAFKQMVGTAPATWRQRALAL